MTDGNEQASNGSGAFRQIGTFAFRECVATTDVGSVYRGYDRDGGQPVVLKIGDPRRSELRLDASTLPQLTHPGIVRMRDAGESEAGELVVVHDAPQGRSLTDAASSYDGQYRQIAHLIRELALTLEHMHGLGVTCGDLSPRTIYIGDDDLPVLSEVGMGLITPESNRASELAKSGADPASARERKFKIDERADVFALGAVLYFLLTGSAPTDQPLALMSDPDAPHDDIAPIERVAPEAPTELRAICAQALATDPVHRYLHAGTMVRDIESYLHGKRGKPVVKFAFVVVGALLVGLFGLWGSVGGGPARILDVQINRAGDGAALQTADRAAAAGDRLTVDVILSKAAYASFFYRDPVGEVRVVATPGPDTPPSRKPHLSALADGASNGWRIPPPSGVGTLVIVSHAHWELPTGAVVAILAGMDAPPRSYVPVVLHGRNLPPQTLPRNLLAPTDDAGRTHLPFPRYAERVARNLGTSADDIAVALLFVLTPN